jgi:type IV pilus assembly protein PilB
MSNVDSSIIHKVDGLLRDAMAKNASDIHIEPMSDNYRIRMRIDGLLYSSHTLHSEVAQRCILRLKVMAQVDISEKRLPQDGRFSIELPPCDIRLSTCPTLLGEKCVLRLLNYSMPIKLDKLGMNDSQTQQFLQTLCRSEGLILITGPTGCGKTVTLYSALYELQYTQKNIITIEDPIEIQLPGINQVNVNAKIGLHFSSALRALLRQDPDVIMIGEIRDIDTARMVMHAAQTGHMVLSTLHTHQVDHSLMRLKNLGISHDELLNVAPLIITQRLLRKLCVFCKNPPIGCSECTQGYRGRIGVFAVNRYTESNTLRTAAEEKVTQGLTTVDEVKRVIS